MEFIVWNKGEGSIGMQSARVYVTACDKEATVSYQIYFRYV